MQMICLKAHTYGGKKIATGETFDVDEKFVPIQVRLGRARVAQDDATDAEQKYPHRSVRRSPRNRMLQAAE